MRSDQVLIVVRYLLTSVFAGAAVGAAYACASGWYAQGGWDAFSWAMASEALRAALAGGGLTLSAGLVVCLMGLLGTPEPQAKPIAERAPRGKLRRRAPKLPAEFCCRARLTAELNVRRASKGFYSLLNLDRQDVEQRPLAQLLHPEDRKLLAAALGELREKREARVVVCRVISGQAPAKRQQQRGQTGLSLASERSFLHLALHLEPRFRKNGELRGCLCWLIDQTALRRAEADVARLGSDLDFTRQRLETIGLEHARLRESYRELYHNSPVMYFSTDTQGKLVTVNETLTRVLGYAREELLEQTYLVLADPGLRDTVPAEGQMVRDGDCEMRWQRKDGTPLDVWMRTVELRDEHGGPVRYRSAALDLSEKNRLADELRARGEEMERTNQRLRETNTELEAFTHVVSHDLKEPLRTLQSYSQMLAEEFSTELGADGFQYVNHLIRASRRLGALIDDLQTLSQIGRGNKPLQVFNLFESVATVRGDLSDLIQRKLANIRTEGTLPIVVGDPQRVNQLLLNLIGNGLKYNRSDAPEVVIGCVATDDPKRATLFVRDNGIGIDAAHHESIFGFFRRLHRSSEFEGTGVGLAICKKIVESYGGKIWVESSPEEGSTFFFTLPRASPELLRQAKAKRAAAPEGKSRTPDVTVRTPVPGPALAMPVKKAFKPSDTQKIVQENPEPAPAAKKAFRPSETKLMLDLDPSVQASAPAPEPSPPAGRPEPVSTASVPSSGLELVLVEDMIEVGTLIQKLGRRQGHNFRWFTSAEEAWAYLQFHRADFLFLDYHLPGMTGLELARRVRKRDKLKDTPIALFTSQDQSPQAAERIQQAGIDYILSKDLLCQPARWQARLNELLAERALVPVA